MKSTMTIRTDESTKDAAQKLFSDLGLDMTTAINIFLRQSIRVGGIPFTINETPNAMTIQAMADAQNDKNMSGPYKTVDEMLEALDA